MSFESLNYNDCCLLINIDLNPQRIRLLLERRFKSNSNKTSFDFKSISPEQPSNNIKVSRSFLRCQPKINYTDDSDEYVSSDSDSSEEDEKDTEDTSPRNDDYYKELAEWDPNSFQPSIATDDDNDDDDEDEIENNMQSITIENDEDDDEIDQMETSAGLNTSTEDLVVTFSHRPMKSEPVPYEDYDDVFCLNTSTEDLVVTFSHRPMKSEPVPYEDYDDVFCNIPQLDGHVDRLPSEGNRKNPDKRLDEVITKIYERTPEPRKAIQIYALPTAASKFHLKNDNQKKSINRAQRKSFSSPVKIDRSKGQLSRDGKQSKKPVPQLLNAVMKSNVDAIRESDTRLSSNQTKTPIPSRTFSNSGLPSKTNKQQDQRKLISQQQTKSSLIPQQRKAPQNQPLNLSQPKGKPALKHMKIAQKKLNHFQGTQQSKSSAATSLPSSSSLLFNKSKSTDNNKNQSKPSKAIDPLVRRSLSTSVTPNLNDHNIKLKKIPKKVKRLNTEQSNITINNSSRTQDNALLNNKKQKTTEDNTTKNQLISHPSVPLTTMTSITSTKTTTGKRPADFFDGCILIDDDDDEKQDKDNNTEDDDIQEIERQQYSIAYNIRARQKDLDHIVHSSNMHCKWLFNLEYLLLDHIQICHDNNLRPSNKIYEHSTVIKSEDTSNTSIYHIEPSFISIIIINFIKVFLLRNSFDDEQEFSFVQFGITSHLRYLLIELPTYIHNEEKDLNDDCSKCHQYSLIINILFDLLFDLIEYDLCGNIRKAKYRSSLIEDDYFTRFLQSKITKKNPFYRIKLIIYFIEVIGMHMNKCPKKKHFQFNQNEGKLIHSIQTFIRHIMSNTNNLINERISVCFNVMELCLLFVNEKQTLIKQMSLFLAELCQNNSTYLNLFLFDENLFVDIRLLLINELIWNKFHIKFKSVTHINTFFQQIQDLLNPKKPIDETAFLLLRSLLSTYADLIIEIKAIPIMYSHDIQQMTLLLKNQFQVIYDKLVEVSFGDSTYFEQIGQTLILYLLLKCKLNKL
ncbi:unnamed protein product [Adineta steineri]|uniref:Uncharacterized protein n=1 Tax=Adineta steineri TaxID=433720 RepID=A0A818QRM5_9BILA|nr:unnamed protein product [Adineta steineri]